MATVSQELLGRNLKRIRSFLNLSQMKLAEKCGLSTNFVSELEGGKVWISAETLDVLCSTLGIEQYRLFLPEEMPEVKTEEILASSFNDLENEIKKATLLIRDKYLKRP